MRYVSLTVRGQELKLRFDLNALVYFEDRTGITLSQLTKEKFGAKALIHALRAGLLWQPKPPTTEELGKLINDGESFTEALLKVSEAFEFMLKVAPTEDSSTGSKDPNETSQNPSPETGN